MKKKVFGIGLVFLMLSANFAFAISAAELSRSLENGLRASESAVNASRSWSNADQANAGWDRYSSQINQAESAIQDAENYESTNGSLNPTWQRQVNQIKANLRQIKNKMSAFGIPTYWAIDL